MCREGTKAVPGWALPSVIIADVQAVSPAVGMHSVELQGPMRKGSAMVGGGQESGPNRPQCATTTQIEPQYGVSLLVKEDAGVGGGPPETTLQQLPPPPGPPHAPGPAPGGIPPSRQPEILRPKAVVAPPPSRADRNISIHEPALIGDIGGDNDLAQVKGCHATGLPATSQPTPPQ